MISKQVFRVDLNPRVLAQMITLILLCTVGYQLALLTWRIGEFLFPPEQVQLAAKNGPSAPADIRLTRLFQHQDKAEVPAVTLSSLNVRLAAVIVSSQPEDSLVILEQSGKQNSYVLHDVISGAQAKITAIYPEKVEVLNEGRTEELRLYDDTQTRPSQRPTSVRSTLLKEPAKLLDLVSISPVHKAGALQGYRLNPGKNAAIFQQSGLQPNDLAIAINGFDLRIPEDAAKFMAQTAEVTQLNITVLRNDAEKTVFLDLSVESME